MIVYSINYFMGIIAVELRKNRAFLLIESMVSLIIITSTLLLLSGLLRSFLITRDNLETKIKIEQALLFKIQNKNDLTEIEINQQKCQLFYEQTTDKAKVWTYYKGKYYGFEVNK